MQTLTLELPAMYGDHHVTEVRRLVFELPGIQDVYASSAFQVVEVTFDPNLTTESAIRSKLETAGYLGDLMVPVETDAPVIKASVKDGNGNGNGHGKVAAFRHTAFYAPAGKSVSFAQDAPSAGRPLWPCPGFGPLNKMDED